MGTAGDGREAIRCYVKAREKGKPYDVVILDLTVRDGMGGRETVKELKKIDPDVRAIVSSGYSQDPTISRFREFGFCGVVSKPYSMTELAQEVAQAIASPDRGPRRRPGDAVGLRVVGCGLRVVGCGLWVVGCGLWVVGCGLRVVRTRAKKLCHPERSATTSKDLA